MINCLLALIFFLSMTVSISAQITQQWAARFNGASDSSDYGWHVFTDEAGNVYTVGHTYVDGADADQCIIKYNSAGVQQWIKTFNGPANGEDHANGAAIDNAGNIYVTGGSTRENTGMDFCTMKYDANGNREWISYYNSVGDSSDEANFLRLDHQNNIYVTGGIKGNSSDMILVKYNSSGEEQFVRTYNGPANGFDRTSSLLLDDSDNIIISGFISGAGTGADYCTIKYNSSGVQQWLRTYNGPSNNFDISNSMAVDDSGNIYVNGTSAGTSNVDYYTIRYDRNGTVKWGTRYNSPFNNSDQGSGIAVDGSGNVYSFGESIGNGSGFDWLVVKYNSTGAEQWTRRYNGTGNDFDDADDILTDGSGNIYLMGASTGDGSDLDFLLMKYNPEGDLQWEKRYNGNGNSFDFPASIAIDNLNNVYLAGNSTGSTGNLDIVTIKYSQSTGIHMNNEIIPSGFRLYQNYPNPFNPVTKIKFDILQDAKSGMQEVELIIYDVLGKKIVTLVKDMLSTGSYEIDFDGSQNASGIYFYSLLVNGNVIDMKEMILLK